MYKKQTLTIAIIFYLIAIVVNINLKQPKIVISKQASSLNLNTKSLLFFSAGNKRLLADLLWIQTLLEADESHYKEKDLNSWMFLRFWNISNLDPKFYQNYLWGGIYLSIIKDDRLGAAEIFEKGIKYYPQDFGLNYNAGFNYYAQLANYKRAYELFEKVQYSNQAPPFLPTLTAKIKYQYDFDYEGTIAILMDQYNKSQDEYLKEKIKKNIYSLKADRDLKCLNEKKNECEKIDLDGNPYLIKDGKYVSPKPYAPYQIHTIK